MSRRLMLLWAPIALSMGCDWTVFSGLEEDAPVVLLNQPSAITSAFGASLATAYSTADDDSVRVWVGHVPGGKDGAQFELGTRQSPTLGAVDFGSCSSSDPNAVNCVLANQIAGMATGLSSAGEEDQCFAVGVGARSEDPDEAGVVIRCADTTEDVLRPPEGFDEYIEDFNLNDQHQPIYFAADRGTLPALIAGAPLQQLAWIYPPRQRPPALLEPPRRLRDRETDFGRQVTVLRVASGMGIDSRRYVVSAPAVGEIWIFQATSAMETTAVGCFSGGENFGRTLAAGRVDQDAVDDLVIAGDEVVTVISGSAIAALEPTTSDACALNGLLQDGLLASFTCGSGESTEGCSGSDFGASIAVGDLDGDGDGEVVVGAPRMDVRNIESAGAVLIYDVEPGDETALAQSLYLTSANAGDLLGTSVVAAGVEPLDPDDLEDDASEPRVRDVIVAGGPGNGRVAVFYCNALVSGSRRGPRCTPKE